VRGAAGGGKGGATRPWPCAPSTDMDYLLDGSVVEPGVRETVLQVSSRLCTVHYYSTVLYCICKG